MTSKVEEFNLPCPHCGEVILVQLIHPRPVPHGQAFDLPRQPGGGVSYVTIHSWGGGGAGSNDGGGGNMTFCGNGGGGGGFNSPKPSPAPTLSRVAYWWQLLPIFWRRRK